MSAAPSTKVEQAYDGPMFDDHDKLYLKVALGLAILTAIEVYLSYSGLEKASLALSLIAFAAVKFIIVAAFFMHLKLDSPLLRRLFIGGAVLAGFCYIAVLVAMGRFSGTGLYAAFGIYGVFSLVMLVVWVFRRDDAESSADHDHAHGHAHGH
jgi:cytochrome c oxidase subunit IV